MRCYWSRGVKIDFGTANTYYSSNVEYDCRIICGSRDGMGINMVVNDILAIVLVSV